ncbi:hypothetical protein F5Y15DRAFT_423202 [Xylariaceae sp. FL0016]|nr:hypothetical protein F5Y15DRAFT_423202 [Xylariaceae sp. FL0016]
MNGAEAERESQKIAAFFEPQERFRFECTIDHGSYGVTCRLVELGPARRLVPAIPPAAPMGERVKKRIRSFTPPGLAETAQNALRGFKRLKAQDAKGVIRAVKRIVTPPGRQRSASPDLEGKTELRRLCLKRSFKEEGIESLRDEIEILRAINGSIHTVGLVAYRDESIPNAHSLARTPFPRTPTRGSDFLAGLPGPTLVIEYLENGSLLRLIRRLISKRKEPIPNRVLWAIYLCAVRACIALACPKRLNPGTFSVLEQLPPESVPLPQRDLVHGDLHVGNLMFGDIDARLAEHTLMPVMKLIDFGITYVRDQAVQINLFDVTQAVYRLIVRQPSFDCHSSERGKYKNIETHAYWLSESPSTADLGLETIAQGEIGLETVKNFDGHIRRNLDPELRDIICRSMAVKSQDRPTLSQVLERAVNGVATKTAASYTLNEVSETDDDVRAFVQQMILDPDANDDAQTPQQSGASGSSSDILQIYT